MKNLIRKTLFLFALTFLFSCSKNEDDTSNTKQSSLFNLNIGNKWVYKNYRNNFDDPTQFTFTGIVDTVKIVSIENIQGFPFAKKSIKTVNTTDGTIQSVTYSYTRINNLGHLVEINDTTSIGTVTETTGLVLHPGNDLNFTYNYNVEVAHNSVGNVQFHRYDEKTITVEGNNYLVLPYNGLFTPSQNDPSLVSKLVERNYSLNIGLIKSVDHSVAGYSILEKRLVSYHLN